VKTRKRVDVLVQRWLLHPQSLREGSEGKSFETHFVRHDCRSFNHAVAG